MRPVFKRVDTCAAEFATNTAYMYSTYEEECEAQPTDKKKIMVVSAAAQNRIGQGGIEFDYCCVHARWRCAKTVTRPSWSTATRKPCRPTYDTSDRLYFEPLTLEDVLEIVHVEKSDWRDRQYGGQTPLKLALRWKPTACRSSAPRRT